MILALLLLVPRRKSPIIYPCLTNGFALERLEGRIGVHNTLLFLYPYYKTPPLSQPA